MIVVRILLNSWATLEARVPTLLRRWARSNCSRSWSVSVERAMTSSPIMQVPPSYGFEGRCGCRPWLIITGIGTHAGTLQSEVLMNSTVKANNFGSDDRLHNGGSKHA